MSEETKMECASGKVPLLETGKFFAIEVKSAKGKQTEDQQAFQMAVERSGGLYILARSVEDVERVFE